jgi:hypothetical protein
MTASLAEFRTMRSSASLIAMSLGLLALAACGGGGGATNTVLADTASSATAASSAPADAAPTALGLSYAMEFVRAPGGSEATLAGTQVIDPRNPSFPNNSTRRERSINARGDFIGAYAGVDGKRHVFFFDHAAHASLPVDDPSSASEALGAGVNDAGLLVGFTTSDTGSVAFTWTAKAGKRQFLSDVAGVESSFANFVSDSGLVSGTICRTGRPICDGYRWDDVHSSLVIYPSFAPFGMDTAGRMMGILTTGDLQFPGAQGSVVTIGLDGSVSDTFVSVSVNTELNNVPLFLADNGDIYMEFVEFAVDYGTVLLKSGETGGTHFSNFIARGLVPRTDPEREFETSPATAFNSSSRAVGIDRVESVDSDTVTSAGFYFSPAERLHEIKVGSTAPTPAGVNKDGIVVGSVFSDGGQSSAFVWTLAAGGALLDSLVSNLPSGLHLSSADAIGDGGHIVVQSNQGLVLLTPQPCAPSP